MPFFVDLHVYVYPSIIPARARENERRRTERRRR
jgi:hypothetical protein